MTINNEIRDKAKANDIKLWQIAYKLGITDSTFSRKLRKELPDEEKRRIVSIIDELSKQKETV